MSRKHLSVRGLFSAVYEQFKKIKTPTETNKRSNPITVTDCLMSAIAVFNLKFPPLLKPEDIISCQSSAMRHLYARELTKTKLIKFGRFAGNEGRKDKDGSIGIYLLLHKESKGEL